MCCRQAFRAGQARRASLEKAAAATLVERLLR